MAANSDSDLRDRRDHKLGMSRIEAVLVGTGGVVALFGVYWDDAWHTDIGRDSALAPPHLALYGGVALAGVVIAVWGLRALARTRSLGAVLRYRPLLFAGLGAVVVLLAAPLDAFWHSAYGRDAVLWSPPHIVTVFGATVMVKGLLSGIDDRRWPLLDEVLAGLLLGNLAVAVMEYETDVPQFSEAYYLPVAVAAALLAAWFARCITGNRYAITIMVAGYVVVRLAITGVLLLLGHSAPDLPIAYLGLLVMDLLIWRTAVERYAAGAAGFCVLALSAATVDLASQSPAALIAPTVVAVAVLAATTVVGRRRLGAPGWQGAASAVVVTTAVVLAAPLWAARPASAHDPGQGENLTRTEFAATFDGDGRANIAVTVKECSTLEPVRLVAKRDGTRRTAPLRRVDGCRFESSVRLPDEGRWFVYAEFLASGEQVETWLPVEGDRRRSVVENRWLYRPTGSAGLTLGEAVTGAAVYLVGLALLGAAVWQARCRHDERDLRNPGPRLTKT
jgi:hypothetical protein